jgi:hypothetical protein
VVGSPDAPPGVFGLRSIQMASIRVGGHPDGSGMVFALLAFVILMETFSISASMGMDIRIITRITIRILFRTTRCIGGRGILGSTALLDPRRDSQLCSRIEQTEDINR